MSYALIREINNHLRKEAPSFVFPYDQSSFGALLSAFLVPIYGLEAFKMISRDWDSSALHLNHGSLANMASYIKQLGNSQLNEAFRRFEHIINHEYYGNMETFLNDEIWQLDYFMNNFFEGFEEFRDAVLLFVFAVPVFPVSALLKEAGLRFHLFDVEEEYVEVQAVLNDLYPDAHGILKNYLSWKYFDGFSADDQESLLNRLQKVIPMLCDGCGKKLIGDDTSFISRIEVYPAKRQAFFQEEKEISFEFDPISGTESSRKADREALQETWAEYRLHLCDICRRTFTRRINSGEII